MLSQSAQYKHMRRERMSDWAAGRAPLCQVLPQRLAGMHECNAVHRLGAGWRGVPCC